ncbi:MAG: hypothetical protein AB1941_19825 [Gemmatimonadota bacterium]
MIPILFADEAAIARRIQEHALLRRRLLECAYSAPTPAALVAAGAQLREEDTRFAEDMHALRPETDPGWLDVWRAFKCPPTHTEELHCRAAHREAELASAGAERDQRRRSAFEKAAEPPPTP